MLLTNAQVSKLRKVFANNSSANVKLSKTKLHKIGKSEGFLGRLLGPLLKMFGYGMTTLIISNEEMNNIIKIVKSLGKSGLFINGVSETIQRESKNNREGFLGMLLGTLGASLLKTS